MEFQKGQLLLVPHPVDITGHHILTGTGLIVNDEDMAEAGLDVSVKLLQYGPEHPIIGLQSHAQLPVLQHLNGG